MSSAQQAVAADWHSLAGRRVAPNMRVQRTSPCGLAADAPSFGARNAPSLL